MSVKVVPLTGGSNQLQTTAEEIDRILTWNFTEGIPQVGSLGIAAPHTGDLAVQAQSAPNATKVLIKAGKMIVRVTPTGEPEKLVMVTLSADYELAIAANTTGGTRYDKVYLYLPAATLATPPANGDFTEAVAIPTAQRDTTAGVALSAGNSILLAEITVANNFTAITNANIKDKRILSALARPYNGWNPVNAELTRTGDYTATLVGDFTNRLSVGDPFQWYSNTTLRKNWLTAVSYAAGTGLTTITITSGYVTTANDSRFENGEAISFAQYSKASSPVGFPPNSDTFSPIGVNRAQVTANQTSITTEVDLTSLTITCTVPTGRRLKITGYTNVSSTATNDVAKLQLYDGVSSVQYAKVALSNGSDDGTLQIQWTGTPTPGAHTYKLTLKRNVGTGSITLNAASASPAYLRAEII